MPSNTSFPFLELPAELRLRIYHFTLDDKLPRIIDGVKDAEPTALLQIRTIIRTELNAELLTRLKAKDIELYQEKNAFSTALEAHKAKMRRRPGSPFNIYARMAYATSVASDMANLEEEIEHVDEELEKVRVLMVRCEKRIPVS